MSIYGHYTSQYYGNSIIFPEDSFLISGISFCKENCKNITYDSELTMIMKENIYDKEAIYIYNEDKHIGFVPNVEKTKTLCKNHITEPLKIINIKPVNNNIGIRVIPKALYVKNVILEEQLCF